MKTNATAPNLFPTSSTIMPLPKEQMKRNQAEWRAYWAIAYIFLPQWQDAMKASKNKTNVARGHFQTNPEKAYETAKAFKRSVLWANIWIFIAVLAGYCGCSIFMDKPHSYVSLVCLATSLLIGVIACFHIKGNVLDGWPGFTVFQIAKAWKPIRRTMEENGIITALIASFQYGNMGRGGPQSVLLNSKEDVAEITTEIHYALREIARNIKEAESDGRPIVRRREKTKFIKLFETAGALDLLRGKQHDDFFKN